jgi:steroid delta-isomerase-like uncharacterized protein
MAVLDIITSSGLGSLLGMRHALEPDHLAAVSTLVTGEQNKQVARRIFEEVMNRGDLQLVNELVADDYRLQEPEGLPAGREGMLTLVQAYRTAFPDLRTTVEDIIAEGETVAVRWSGTGTQSGTFMGMPATGQRAKVKAISWLRFKNGRLAEEWSEMSGLGMPR